MGKQKRAPIVTVMGHVDHGKTSILDAIRKTNVQKGEAGGITQSIGAYQINYKQDLITFIDTPGHYAFAQMRARGGQIADIVVLVIAADDGFKPQTEEALNHARAAGVPIIVVVNKIDLPAANINKIKKQLSDHEVDIVEYGGKVPVVEVSATAGTGIEQLLETIINVSSDVDLSIKSDKPTQFTVVEGYMDDRKGVIAHGIIRSGVLKVRDFIVGGSTFARVRALNDWQGKPLKEAVPSQPVSVMGFKEVPDVGVTYSWVASERDAEKVIQDGREDARLEDMKFSAQDRLKMAMDSQQKNEIAIVIKTDSQGTLEVVLNEIRKLDSQEVSFNIVHSGIGNISENDILLAFAAKGIVIGFNTDIDHAAETLALREKVIYRLYQIIYELIDELTDVMQGEIDSLTRQVLGKAKVKQVFKLSDKTLVAGSVVIEGRVRKGNRVEVWRGKEMIAETRITSLRVEKDDTSEVKEGRECGIQLGRDIVVEIGDVIQATSE